MRQHIIINTQKETRLIRGRYLVLHKTPTRSWLLGILVITTNPLPSIYDTILRNWISKMANVFLARLVGFYQGGMRFYCLQRILGRNLRHCYVVWYMEAGGIIHNHHTNMHKPLNYFSPSSTEMCETKWFLRFAVKSNVISYCSLMVLVKWCVWKFNVTDSWQIRIYFII